MTKAPDEIYPCRAQAPASLLVFARLPELGHVKSRIARDTGESAALDLYRAMLEDLLDNIGDEDEDLVIELFWTSTAPPAPGTLRDLFGRRRMSRQEGADLGERLTTAFNERTYFLRCPKVLAIGTDLPSLTREEIDHAILLLDSCDWVLGPSDDGGYYLIGCRAEAWLPTLFSGIDWGTESVLEETEARIRRAGHSIAMLPRRTDLDTVEDLDTSLDAELSPRTFRLWAELSEVAR